MHVCFLVSPSGSSVYLLPFAGQGSSQTPGLNLTYPALELLTNSTSKRFPQKSIPLNRGRAPRIFTRSPRKTVPLSTRPKTSKALQSGRWYCLTWSPINPWFIMGSPRANEHNLSNSARKLQRVFGCFRKCSDELESHLPLGLP